MKTSGKWMIASLAGALILVGLCLACIAGAILMPLRWWTMGGAVTSAKTYLEHHPVVRAKLGPVKGFGAIPQGTERVVNGEGLAHLTITVRGARQSAIAVVDLSRKGGGLWVVTRAELDLGSEKILLEGAPAPPNDAKPHNPKGRPDAGETGWVDV